MSVDFVEAARAQLAKWLTTELARDFPTIIVHDEWPEPARELERPSISVIEVGDPQTEGHAPIPHRVTQTTGPSGMLLYSFGRTVVSMQLDLWAENKDQRNRLAMATSAAVNVNPIYSIPLPDALPDYRRQPGLMLKLDDCYGILADYRFEQVASPVEDSDAAQSHEWRSTYAGDVLFHAVTMEQVALVKRIILRESVNGSVAEETIIS